MPFDPKMDIEDLSGKVVFVTGGTSGIGRATVLALALHQPSLIAFTGRDEESGRAVCADVKQSAPSCAINFIKCDLSAPRETIRSILRDSFHASRLDIFIANAGVMATPAALTAEGFEAQFSTNFLGHAVMLRLLRPLMVRTAEALASSDVRVIMLSSFGHTMHPPGGIDFDRLKVADAGTTWQRYGQSKLADILLAKAMARQFPSITSVSVHPGLVKTRLLEGAERSSMTRLLALMRWIMPSSVYLSAEEGAHNTLWAATAPKANLENGGYYEPVGRKAGKKTRFSGMAQLCNDEILARELWDWTEKELADVEW